MWGYALAGLVFGIFGGPVVIYGLGTLVVLWRERKVRKQISQMVGAHNNEVKHIKKEYEAAQKRFLKLRSQIQRIIAKAKES